MGDATNPSAPYLRPTEVLDSDHPDLIHFAGHVTQGMSDPREQARRLFYTVRDEIAYDVHTPFFLPEHYRASSILKRGRGFCVPKACLLCAACRAIGIPSRLGFADIRNYGASSELIEMMGCNLFTFHGFVELFLGGQWIKVTPAFDRKVYETHNIAPVEFDGYTDAVLPSHDLNGNPYVEYVSYHGSFEDLPLDRILEAWRDVYGADRVRAWTDALKAAGIA